MKKNIIVLSAALAVIGISSCQSTRSTPAGDSRTDSLSTASVRMNNASNSSTVPGSSTPATNNTGIVEQGGMVPNNSYARSDNRDRTNRNNSATNNNQTNISNQSVVNPGAMSNAANPSATDPTVTSGTGNPATSSTMSNGSNNSLMRGNTTTNSTNTTTNTAGVRPDMSRETGVSKESAPTVNSYLSKSSRSGNTSGKELPNNPENMVAPPSADTSQRTQAMTTPGQRNGVNATESMTATSTNVEKAMANPTSGTTGMNSSKDLMSQVNKHLETVDQELKASPSAARRTELNQKRQKLVGALNKLQEVETTLSQMDKNSSMPKK
ncbi:hypothetical protein BWI97_11215 [Siphonobacter sp. BAB-5405]|uniref:hypothetical protein n=1 Tax=Siphonobacter sp. BAB-5405 TaxID=1864825 RepID=UPI000C7F7AAA|nr:hypothetical protein [Siphonobacter sp. BAB-5405]PMD96732.1 hypothetical protein BWI97_11215 [Siphonobacter sp. BAB-5405]